MAAALLIDRSVEQGEGGGPDAVRKCTQIHQVCNDYSLNSHEFYETLLALEFFLYWTNIIRRYPDTVFYNYQVFYFYVQILKIQLKLFAQTSNSKKKI